MASKKPRFLSKKNILKTSKVQNLGFKGFFYIFLVKFYTNLIKFHILNHNL